MTLLIDDERIKNAHIKSEERSQLRKKRLELVATRERRSDNVKIDTIKTFLALGGNLPLTAGATGIPFNTLKTWKATNWWKEVITELRKAEKLELSANTKKILDRSLVLLSDRLENGDYIYDQKKGKLIRKPLPAKDIHKIAIDMMDRKDKLDKDTEEEKLVTHDDKLISLAERFAALAVKAVERQNRNTGDVVDIDSEDVQGNDNA